MTDSLVRTLAANLAPVSPWYVTRKLVVGVGAGVMLSAVLMLLVLGVRPDITHMMGTGVFCLKQAYTLVFAVLAGLTAERLARPAANSRQLILWLLIPLLLVSGIAAVQLSDAAAGARMPMLMGGSAAVCPWRILFFAIPPLAGLIWAMRDLAPVRLREAGAAVGLAAGGAGAFIYALHCREDAVPFIAAWYTLGMALSALLGRIIGPVLLRWR